MILRNRSISSVSLHRITCILKGIHCVSLEVETELIDIILISCFKRTAFYNFYIRLGTRVPQG